MIFAQSYKNLSYLQKKKENFSSFIKEKQYLCTLIIKKYDMPQSLHIAIIGGGAAGFFAAIEEAQLPSRRHHYIREEFEGSRQGGNHGRRKMQSYQFL